VEWKVGGRGRVKEAEWKVGKRERSGGWEGWCREEDEEVWGELEVREKPRAYSHDP